MTAEFQAPLSASIGRCPLCGRPVYPSDYRLVHPIRGRPGAAVVMHAYCWEDTFPNWTPIYDPPSQPVGPGGLPEAVNH
jgi:hypothetical protein